MKLTFLHKVVSVACCWLAFSLTPTAAQKLTIQPKWSARLGISNAAGQSFNPIKGLRIVRTLPFTNEYSYHASLAFDDVYAYISTPNGLYRTTRTLNIGDPVQLVAFPDKRILNLYVHNNTLYVLKVGEETMSSPPTEHSFLESTDHGNTFTALDNGLSYCLSGYCAFLTSTVARFVDPLIFLNAG